MLPGNHHWYFIFYISQDNSAHSFLFIYLDNINGTYAFLAFISGVEHKNPSIDCEIAESENIYKRPKTFQFSNLSTNLGMDFHIPIVFHTWW